MEFCIRWISLSKKGELFPPTWKNGSICSETSLIYVFFLYRSQLGLNALRSKFLFTRSSIKFWGSSSSSTPSPETTNNKNNGFPVKNRSRRQQHHELFPRQDQLNAPHLLHCPQGQRQHPCQGCCQPPEWQGSSFKTIVLSNAFYASFDKLSKTGY